MSQQIPLADIISQMWRDSNRKEVVEMSDQAYVRRCRWCDWTMLSHDRNKLLKCESCGKVASTADMDEFVVIHGNEGHDMTCTIAEIVKKRDQRIWKHAQDHGLLVYKVSKRRWSVFQIKKLNQMDYKSGAKYAFQTLELVEGPMGWWECMDYIRMHTPELPEYLKKEEGLFHNLEK